MASGKHRLVLPALLQPGTLRIEPLWRDVKQHRMRSLSRESLLSLKRGVDVALTEKAADLRSDNSLTECT
jgi:hypothetical protein